MSPSAAQLLRSAELNSSNPHSPSVTFSLRKKNRKKGLLPLGFITGLVLSSAFLFYFAQGLLGPQISALFTKATDLQYTAYTARNQRLLSFMLDGGQQIKISNFTKRYTYFSPFLQKRLQKQGIDIGHLDADGTFSKGQQILGRSTVLKYNNQIIDANSFQDHYANDANFRESYYKAKRGRVAGFFDKVSEKFYRDRGANRNIFAQFKGSGDPKKDRQNFQDIVQKRVTGTDGTINSMHQEIDDQTKTRKNQYNGDAVDTAKLSGQTPETKARQFIHGIAGKVSTVGVPICSGLRIANMAAVAVAASKIATSTAYFLSLMEPISKTIAGHGDTAAINENLNFFTKTSTQPVQYLSEDGSPKTKNVTGSMLDATGAKIIMGNTYSDPAASMPFAIDNITKALNIIILSTGATNLVCSSAMAASAIVSLSFSAVPGGTLAHFVVGSIMRIFGAVAITGIVALIVNTIIPYAAQIFFTDLFKSYNGVPAGELFAQGAAAANFALASDASALMPASKERIKSQNRHQTIALNQERAVENLHQNQLDLASPRSFLAQLLSKLATLSHPSFPKLFSQFLHLTRHASLSLMPAAFAADTDIVYTNISTPCPNLKGAECDIYGQPIVAYDFSTINTRPDDPTYQAVIQKNLDANGNIINNSNLARFISFCSNRRSPWGFKDANILNALQSDAGVVLENLPVVNNLLDVFHAAEDVKNEPWATGSICLNSKDNPVWENEFKYYQLYVADSRYLAGMEDPKVAANPVLAYEANYKKSHPKDQSIYGQIATISGLTKNQVASLFDFIATAKFQNSYQPAQKLPYPATKLTPGTPKSNFKLLASALPKSIPNSFFAMIAHTPTFHIDKRGILV